MRSVQVIIALSILIWVMTALHVHENNRAITDHKSASQKQAQIIDAMKLYRKDQQIEKQIDRVVANNPQVFKKSVCKNDNSINYLVVERRKLSSKQAIKQVIISCNIHARQLLVSEVCIDFISALSAAISGNQKNKQPRGSRNQFDLPSINQLLVNARLTVFYRGNNMRDDVISGKDYCIRKDKDNIDLNRNFPTNFNSNNVSKQKQQYPGDSPLSEPYSQCLDDYLQQINQTHKVNIFIDIHTGQFTLFDPFQSQSRQGYETLPLLEKLKDKYCPQCRITSIGSQNDDQITDGQIFADIKKRYKADHSVLLQIYGGYNQNLDIQKNCIVIFNPTTQRELNYYKDIWKNGLLYFIKLALKNIKE